MSDKKVADLFKEVKARYKIEVVFGTDRSNIANYGIILWDSLNKTAEGDSLLGFCPNRDCKGIVHRPEGTMEDPDPTVGFCSICKTPFKLVDMADMKCFRSSMDVLAEKLEQVYVALGHNADIYLKFHPKDIRYEAKDRNVGNLFGARGARRAAIYPMDRIMKDTNNGSTLKSRFMAFVTA
jgi:hypothetical protein